MSQNYHDYLGHNHVPPTNQRNVDARRQVSWWLDKTVYVVVQWSHVSQQPLLKNVQMQTPSAADRSTLLLNDLLFMFSNAKLLTLTHCILFRNLQSSSELSFWNLWRISAPSCIVVTKYSLVIWTYFMCSISSCYICQCVLKGLDVDFIIALSACVSVLSFSIHPCHSCLLLVSLDCKPAMSLSLLTAILRFVSLIHHLPNAFSEI